MKKTLELYENYRKVLEAQRKEIMDALKATDDGSDEAREVINDLMGLASHVNSDIVIVDIIIKRIKRRNAEKFLEEA